MDDRNNYDGFDNNQNTQEENGMNMQNQFDYLVQHHREQEQNGSGQENIAMQPPVWQEVYNQPYQMQPSRPRRSKAGWIAAAMAACCILSGIAGAGATALAGGILKGNQTTLYQSDTPSSTVKTVNAGTGEKMTVAQISAALTPCVVSIRVQSTTTGMFGRQQTTEGSGSGVIISEDGYIVTNNHVIEGASDIKVTLASGEEHTAKLIGSDAKTDLAVLKIEATGLPCAVLGDSASLNVGDLAVAIGNPLGELSGTVTQGIISALDRTIQIEEDGEEMNLLQTDAAVNPGNSGGALVNEYGQVIGIVVAKKSALGIEGLGFAIPINDAKPIIEDLIENGHVSGRTSIGIVTQDISAQVASVYRMKEGVYIREVVQGGAAEKAGIKAGDHLVSVNGVNISTTADLKKEKDKHGVGDVLKVVIDRDGTEMTVNVILQEEQ